MIGRGRKQGSRRSGEVVSTMASRSALKSSYRDAVNVARVSAEGRDEAHNNTKHV
jgi:hypothetical protein